MALLAAVFAASCAGGAAHSLAAGQVATRRYVASLPDELRANDEAYLQARLEKYCAWPPYSALSEAVLPGFPGLELRQVHVLIRHGDRSAIHEGQLGFDDRDPVDKPLCDTPGQEELRVAAATLMPFRSSPDCILLGDEACDAEKPGAPLTDALDHALDAWGKARTKGSLCGPRGGELSTRGWQQVHQIGTELGEVYLPFLRRPDMSSVPLQVVSTDFGRTVLTAAAFVHGFLSPVDQAHVVSGAREMSLAAAVERVASVEEDAALVNGPLSALKAASRLGPLPELTLPLPLHIVDRKHDPMLILSKGDACPHARTLQEREGSEMFAHAKLTGSAGEAVSRLMGEPPGSEALPHTEKLADVLFARLCHGQRLPCLKKDGTGCMTRSDAAAVLKEGDLLYGTRFNTSVTPLTAFPLWSQIGEAMHRASDREPGYPRVVVRAGHDTVLTPLLATFGIRDGHVSWPGYASRVVLELWAFGDSAPSLPHQKHPYIPGFHHVPEPPPLPGVQTRSGLDTPGAHRGHDGVHHDGHYDHRKDFVRLLFNGVDWTDRLPCARPLPTTVGEAHPMPSVPGERDVPPPPHLLEEGARGGGAGHPPPPPPPPSQVRPRPPATGPPTHLCSLADFESIVDVLIHPHSTWTQACNPGADAPSGARGAEL